MIFIMNVQLTHPSRLSSRVGTWFQKKFKLLIRSTAGPANENIKSSYHLKREHVMRLVVVQQTPSSEPVSYTHLSVCVDNVKC